jgi:predicted MFS family arabinose efflux permease
MLRLAGNRAGDKSMEAGSNSGGQATRPADWWALILVLLAYSFYNLDKSLLSVLIEPIKAEFGLSDSYMGLLTGLATSLPFAMACIPVGLLADRVNRRNLLVMLVGGWSMVTALTSFAGSASGLFASRVGVGVFEAGFTPVSLSSLCDRFPLRLRSTALGIFNLGAPGGLFAGMALGGLIADNYGWRTAFLVAGAPGLLWALLLWQTTDEPIRGGGDDIALNGEPGGLKAVLGAMVRDAVLRNIIIGMTWAAAMLAVFAVWTPSLLRRTFALSATHAGFDSALIVGVAGAVGAASGGLLADRVGRNRLDRKLLVPIVGTLLSIAAGVTALLGGLSPLASSVLLGFASFFGQFYIGTCYGLAATLAGPSRRTTTLSIMLVSFNLISYSLGAGLVGKVSDMLVAKHGLASLRYAYAAGFIFSALAALHLCRAYQLLRRHLG